MVKVQFVTVTGCEEARCESCDIAETVLRQALDLAGSPLPPHGTTSEAYLADGRIVEAAHISCEQANEADLDPGRAPFLLIDDEVAMSGLFSVDAMAQLALKALKPDGLADLRP